MDETTNEGNQDGNSSQSGGSSEKGESKKKGLSADMRAFISTVEEPLFQEINDVINLSVTDTGKRRFPSIFPIINFTFFPLLFLSSLEIGEIPALVSGILKTKRNPVVDFINMVSHVLSLNREIQSETLRIKRVP